jgi:DNA-binding XRE family transcriptional regulator
MAMTTALIERRDARQIKELARHLCVSGESLTTGDGLLTLVPVDLLLQLRDAFGDAGMSDCWVVIDGPALAAMQTPAGIRSIDDELKAVREAQARRQPMTPIARAEAQARRQPMTPIARAKAQVSGTPLPPRAPGDEERLAIRDEVRAAKRVLGMSIREFANAVGVSQGTVGFWTSGRYRPSPDNLAAIRAFVAEAGR